MYRTIINENNIQILIICVGVGVVRLVVVVDVVEDVVVVADQRK